MLDNLRIPLYRYKFGTKDIPPGTYLWHDHTGGLDANDGIFGPLIVKHVGDTDPHYDLYDHDCDHHPSGKSINFLESSQG